MPGLVTILCHAECLGAWASFWAPCRGMWPFASKFRAAFTSPTDASNVVISCDLVSRSDVCGWRWHMNRRECMEATLEHLMWLLYPKFAHYTFTMAAFRIVKWRLRGKGMTLHASYVLLKFLWLVVTMFGPCLPILNTLIALIANIYSILLFGTDVQVLDAKKTESFGFILDVKETEEHCHGASLPTGVTEGVESKTARKADAAKRGNMQVCKRKRSSTTENEKSTSAKPPGFVI
eukprot:912153-Amphidinium_carterae.1